MAIDDITPEVRRFLEEHIRSVSQLELLLLLRTTAEQSWTAEQLSRELRVDTAWTASQLKGFAAADLLECFPGPSADEPEYRFAPSSPEKQRAVGAVARAYLLHRISVTERIYGKPSDPFDAFADAFRLKKNKDSDG